MPSRTFWLFCEPIKTRNDFGNSQVYFGKPRGTILQLAIMLLIGAKHWRVIRMGIAAQSGRWWMPTSAILQLPITRPIKEVSRTGVAAGHSIARSLLRHQHQPSVNLLTRSVSACSGGETLGTRGEDSEALENARLEQECRMQATMNTRLLKEHRAREAARSFIDILMKAPVDQVSDSDGVTVLRESPSFLWGSRHDSYLTKSQDMFWDDILATDPDEADRFATCYADTSIVIRKLLERGNAVVYHAATEDRSRWFYEFIAHGGTYTAQVYPEKGDRDDVPSLLEASTYYIVDIDLAKTRFVDPPMDFKPKIICVTSNSFDVYVTSRMIQSKMGSCWEFRQFPAWEASELGAKHRDMYKTRQPACIEKDETPNADH
jgi:hypothetical protein